MWCFPVIGGTELPSLFAELGRERLAYYSHCEGAYLSDPFQNLRCRVQRPGNKRVFQGHFITQGGLHETGGVSIEIDGVEIALLALRLITPLFTSNP